MRSLIWSTLFLVFAGAGAHEHRPIFRRSLLARGSRAERFSSSSSSLKRSGTTSGDIPGFLPEYGNPTDGSPSPIDYGALLREQLTPSLPHACFKHQECGTDHMQYCGFPPKKWWAQAHLTGVFIYTAACLPCKLCVPKNNPGEPMTPYNGHCPPCLDEVHLLGKYAPTGDEEDPEEEE